MEHPEYAVYVVVVYAVTFGLLGAYLLWLWRGLQAEQQWVRNSRSNPEREGRL